MALITVSEVVDYIGIDGEDLDSIDIYEDYTERITDLANTYCNRIFEAADYTEYHNSRNTNKILVKNPPINSLSRVSVGRQDAMYVYNTSEYTTAFVSVNSTGIVLTKDGTSDSTCTFDSYTTMTTMVDAINAIGSGWVASLVSSAYTNYKSNELLVRYAANALDNNYVYLEIPEEAEEVIEVSETSGIIYLDRKISAGVKKIRVDYNGGYAEASIPKDLKHALIQEIVRWDKERKNPHMASSTTKDTTISYISKELMPQTKDALNRYRIFPRS